MSILPHQKFFFLVLFCLCQLKCQTICNGFSTYTHASTHTIHEQNTAVKAHNTSSSHSTMGLSLSKQNLIICIEYIVRVCIYDNVFPQFTQIQSQSQSDSQSSSQPASQPLNEVIYYIVTHLQINALQSNEPMLVKNICYYCYVITI